MTLAPQKTRTSRWTGFVFLGLLSAGCAPRYQVVDSPVAPLGRFGGVVLGRFSTRGFLISLKGTSRYAPYLPVTEKANYEVYEAVQSRLGEVPFTPGAPRLVLSATLVDFMTGSGVARALQAFDLVPEGAGDGRIVYHIVLSAAGRRVASYNVHQLIRGGAEGAYQAEGANIVRFLMDHP